jgi:hypothetical protein
MIAKVLGIRRGIDFTSDDGKQIKGVKLHICYCDKNVEGYAVKSLFVNESIDCSHIVPDNSYDFIFESNFGGRSYLSRIDEVKF